MPIYQVSVYIPIGHIRPLLSLGSRGGLVLERRTLVREVQGSNPHDRREVSLNKTH